jgi:hypothetical protein
MKRGIPVSCLQWAMPNQFNPRLWDVDFGTGAIFPVSFLTSQCKKSARNSLRSWLMALVPWHGCPQVQPALAFPDMWSDTNCWKLPLAAGKAGEIWGSERACAWAWETSWRHDKFIFGYCLLKSCHTQTSIISRPVGDRQ